MVSLRFALSTAALLALFAASGCNYRVHLGDHDGGATLDGSSGCALDTDCSPGNQCVCGRCITLDLPAPACNPDCTFAREGDLCTGVWACPALCPGGGLRCDDGVARRVPAACVDAGMCECPAPPPGCRYEGWPCPCDRVVCESEPCGPTTCEPGLVCCNASCGICVEPGGSCPELECPSCDPMDARGEGLCFLDFGWAWNGSGCDPIGGCSCEGADCGRLAPTEDACLDAYWHCPRSCGGLGGSRCRADELCDWDLADMCGAADATGVCRPRPDTCSGEVVPVCGCDGRTYTNECAAHATGVDVAHAGPCERAHCEAESAYGSGGCAAVLGVVWDGSACRWISGCSCEGADCAAAAERLSSPDPVAACEAEHADCLVLLP